MISAPSPCSTRCAGHERAVDLQRVHRELLQVAQRTIAGAEVVEADPHADGAQLGSTPRTCVGSAIAALSVISSRSSCAATGPLAQGIDDRGDRAPALPNALADRLTLTVSRSAAAIGSPPRRGLPAGLGQHPLVDRPRSTPSLVGHRRNSAGAAGRASGCCQRTSASKPATRRSASETIGWYCRRNSCRSTARRSSVSSCSRSDGGYVHGGVEHRVARRRRRPWRDTWPGRRRAPLPRPADASDALTAMPMLGVTNTSCPSTRERRRRQPLDALGHAHGVDRLADVVEQDDELVAAEAGERVGTGASALGGRQPRSRRLRGGRRRPAARQIAAAADRRRRGRGCRSRA